MDSNAGSTNAERTAAETAQRMPDSAGGLPVAFGFGFLGLLVGSVAGLSSAELTLPLFGFLFALAGGSVIAFLDKIPRHVLTLAGGALASFSVMAALSLYAGLYVKVNELMYRTPTALASRSSTASSVPAVRGTHGNLMRSDSQGSFESYLMEELALGRIGLGTACTRLGQADATKAGDQR